LTEALDWNTTDTGPDDLSDHAQRQLARCRDLAEKAAYIERYVACPVCGGYLSGVSVTDTYNCACGFRCYMQFFSKTEVYIKIISDPQSYAFKYSSNNPILRMSQE
jgi:hypothetical protein